MRIGLLPAALMLLACSHTPPASHPVPARGPSRDSLLASDNERTLTVRERGPVSGMLLWLRPDIVYLRGGTPAVRGIAAARSLMADTANFPGAVAWQPLGGDLSADRRAGYTFGVAARPFGGDSVSVERYIAFWKRDGGAAPWRIAAYVEVAAPFRAKPGADTTSALSRLGIGAASANTQHARGVLALMGADSAFSDLADRVGVGAAFATTVAPDGAVFGGTELVVGPKAVRDFYASRDAASGLAWHPIYADIAASSDLGFTIGQYISTGRGPSGAAVQSFGKYLTVWQRQSDGTWKFVVDGGNPSPAPRPELRP